MRQFGANKIAKLGWTGALLSAMAMAQAVPAQNNVVSSAPTASIREVPDAPVDTTETAEISVDPASLLPDLPSLPRDKASLVGGTIQKLDRVRDQITVQLFGGGRMKILFDPRTRIFKGSALASASDLHPGDRVYVDTILNDSTVFARNIRLKANATSGTTQGSVLSYRADKGELEMRDMISPNPLKLKITSKTRVIDGAQSVAASVLTPGTLVAVQFGAQQDGSGVASEVSILARPGASFTFAGHVIALDLSVGLLALTSDTDGKTYDVYLDPTSVNVDDKLRPGVDVTADTHFDGSRYVVRSLTVNAK